MLNENLQLLEFPIFHLDLKYFWKLNMNTVRTWWIISALYSRACAIILRATVLEAWSKILTFFSHGTEKLSTLIHCAILSWPFQNPASTTGMWIISHNKEEQFLEITHRWYDFDLKFPVKPTCSLLLHYPNIKILFFLTPKHQTTTLQKKKKKMMYPHSLRKVCFYNQVIRYFCSKMKSCPM